MNVDTAADTAGVTSIDPAADPRWDAYVRAHPAATAVHLAGWQQVIQRTYRSAGRHLALVRDGEIRGVLPLVARRGLLTGRRLRSLPGMVAGPLADDLEGATALLRAAADLAQREDAVLAIGSRLVGVDEEAAGVGASAGPPTFILDVAQPPEETRAGWKRSGNLSRSLRKAEASGMTVRLSTSDQDLRRFHDLYVRTMRKHASLPRSLRQLRLERELLGDETTRLFVVEHEGQMIAGGWYHVFNGEIVLVFNASHEDALSLRPNHLLYWHTMCWAHEQGLRSYDLGYAWPDSPLGQFKAQWGAAEVPEIQYAWPPVVQNLGERHGAGNQRVTDAVQRLPVPVLRNVAAAVYRYL